MLERRDRKTTDLTRRVANMVVIGNIAQADHKRARYRVKVGEILSDWIPDTQPRAGKTRVYEGRDIGEQVVMVSPSGDLAQGIIVGSIHTESNQAADKGSIHRTIYPDGTTLDYDDEANAFVLAVKDGGSFDLRISGGAGISARGGKLTIRAPEGIDFQSNGVLALNANGGVSITTPQAIATSSSSLTNNGKDISGKHRHKGVQPGGGLTGEPE